ncbi:insulinase family protein [Marinomonas sp. RS-M-Aa-14]
MINTIRKIIPYWFALTIALACFSIQAGNSISTETHLQPNISNAIMTSITPARSTQTSNEINRAKDDDLSTSPTGMNMLEIPNKSLTDKNDYRLITLPNHLKVLLVSDPQAERFSASLAVNVGSFQDPDNQQGLAHFLEHMLFLGTEKYPEPGDYQSYINHHGGSNNAYTSTDTTNFYFDIKPSAYEGALDRFAQFFTTPLFSESLTQREKNAVDSEYKAKLKDESRRNNQAFKTLLNPKHPYSRFTVGNLETLKDRPEASLRKQLLTLYNEHYFSENMALVLVTNLSHQDMATLAKQYFSDIPSKQTPTKQHYPTLMKTNQPQLQFVQSLIDSNTLSFQYQIDAQENHYKTRPTRYLSYILGNENEGSLYASLKADGLINSLSAGVSPDYGNNAFFTVTAHLTNSGLTNIDTVAKRIFATIGLLQSTPINPMYQLEGVQLSQLMYNNQNYTAPQNLARTLSAKLLKIPAIDILSSFRIEKTADNKQVRQLLKQLDTKHLLVQVATNKAFPKHWAKQKPTWQTEPWYQSTYSNNEFSSAFLDFINLSVKNTHVTLPEKNRFIPEHLDLITEKDTTPNIVFHQQGFTFWHKSDPSFGKPTAMNFIAIRFNHAADSPQNALLNQLWSRLYNDSISELTYSPYIAGLGYQFYPHANGMTLRTSGYSDKQNTYTTWLIDQVFLFRPSAERFAQIKTQLAKDFANQKSRQAYSNAYSTFSTLITKDSFTIEQLENALPHLSFEDLQQYIKEARASFDLVGYSTGNVTKEQTQALAHSLHQRFVGRLVPKKPIEIQTKPIPANQKMHYPFTSTSSDNVVLYTLIDTSPETSTSNKAITEKAYFAMLRKLVNSRFYQELRTQKQLGYIVGAQDLSIRNTPILGLLVQSPNQDMATIISTIEDFLKEEEKRLLALTKEEFDTTKIALLDELNMTAKNLSDNALEEWHQIAKPTPDFHTKKEWIDSVEAIDKTDFIDFLENKLRSESISNIIIHNKAFPAALTSQGWIETSPDKLTAN